MKLSDYTTSTITKMVLQNGTVPVVALKYKHGAVLMGRTSGKRLGEMFRYKYSTN